MEIKKLTKENYDELISLLNRVFSIKNKRTMNFELELPKMCIKDNEHMEKHLGVFEDGKMCAALGVYPLPTIIGEESLLFSTVGNVATLPEYEGRGFMGALMSAAMDELASINADASRLGGNRQRYNRFGYETAGSSYNFTFTEYNRIKCFTEYKNNIKFKKIKKDDKESLEYTLKLHNTSKIHVIRSDENNYRDVYASLTAWRNNAYIIEKDEQPIGYLSVSPTLETVAEIHTETTEYLPLAICAWQEFCGETVSLTFAPYEVNEIQAFYKTSPTMTITSPCLFKICNWDRVIGALMKLKASYCQLADGEAIIGIKDYGNLYLKSSSNETMCERTTLPCSFELDVLGATRFFLDPFPPVCNVPSSYLFDSWFPLPLSWNLQDRV